MSHPAGTRKSKGTKRRLEASVEEDNDNSDVLIVLHAPDVILSLKAADEWGKHINLFSYGE